MNYDLGETHAKDHMLLIETVSSKELIRRIS